MPKYDYEIAMEKLSDSDKNRCLAAYFSMDNANAHVRPREPYYPRELYILTKPPPPIHLEIIATTTIAKAQKDVGESGARPPESDASPIAQTLAAAASSGYAFVFGVWNKVVDFDYQTNWAVATKSFGAASENSMRTMVGSAMKKIRDNGGEYNADGSRIPATAKKAGGRKPKNDQGENDDEDGDSYEIKKGGGGRKRAAADDGKVTRNVEGKKPIKRARGKKVVEDVKPEDEADAIPGTDKDADIADNIVVKTETQVEDEDEDEQV
ncbi:hypothetical protein KVT40_001523 [Elsinoe batatas]|uniref:Uncharacterized protein n=1 Tax=Elsinoe batatas TaxID=2601811 RepID=A0A8K0L7H6_9PEZI|nr:hypothetical protein KVT40_001523 [Elsinoe batatas]